MKIKKSKSLGRCKPWIPAASGNGSPSAYLGYASVCADRFRSESTAFAGPLFFR